jgi:hypothetical protein
LTQLDAMNDLLFAVRGPSALNADVELAAGPGRLPVPLLATRNSGNIGDNEPADMSRFFSQVRP